MPSRFWKFLTPNSDSIKSAELWKCCPKKVWVVIEWTPILPIIFISYFQNSKRCPLYYYCSELHFWLNVCFKSSRSSDWPRRLKCKNIRARISPSISAESIFQVFEISRKSFWNLTHFTNVDFSSTCCILESFKSLRRSLIFACVRDFNWLKSSSCVFSITIDCE